MNVLMSRLAILITFLSAQRCMHGIGLELKLDVKLKVFIAQRGEEMLSSSLGSRRSILYEVILRWVLKDYELMEAPKKEICSGSFSPHKRI